MRTIYKSDNVELSVEFDEFNNLNTVFGKLKLIIGDKLITTEETQNLGYFYVDCENFISSLEDESIIHNPLFELSDDELIHHYNCWLNYNIEEEESSIVHFFDSNYFLTGSRFKSYFFDHIMIMYMLENSVCYFKIWTKTNPISIICVSAQEESVLSGFKKFIKTFDEYVQSNTNKWKMENESQ